MVVSGLPAPKGVAGVIVQDWSRREPRPRRALVFVDQEGGSASTFDELPPGAAASSFQSPKEALAAGRATGNASSAPEWTSTLRPSSISPVGPLGPRHFAEPAESLAFARGLEGGRCVPEAFPGSRIRADLDGRRPARARARLLPAEVRAFRMAVADGATCVMVGHAFYKGFGLERRASFNPAVYRLLRRPGFDGVAITDSVSVFGSEPAVPSAKRAVRAGADLVLLTNGRTRPE